MGQILDYLDSREIIGEKILAWLKTYPPQSSLVEMKQLLNDTLAADLNIFTRTLSYPGDLDVMFIRRFKAKRDSDVEKLRQYLNLSQDDWVFIANKFVAADSLRSYASQHEPVRDFCKQEAQRRNTRAGFEAAIAYNNTLKNGVKIFPPYTVERKLPPNP